MGNLDMVIEHTAALGEHALDAAAGMGLAAAFINPDRLPTCPKCGNRKMQRQMSRFAMPKGVKEPTGAPDIGEDGPAPDFDDPRVMRAMGELERDMEHLDENNPKHMAHLMKKMKDIMPPGVMPKEMDVAIKRLEAGEDPEKIEEDMGDVLGDLASRRAAIEGMEPRQNTQVIRAMVPLAELFGYATDLRSSSQGRGVFTMEFHHYQQLPQNLAEEALKGNTNGRRR